MSEKSYHHGNLRNSLIEAGIKLIDESGESQFSLRRVAAECNVSYSAPYSHFKSKEELLIAMQEYVTLQLTETILEIIDEYPNKNDQHLLIEIGKRYASFFIELPHYFRFLFSSPFIKIDISLDVKNDNFPPFTLFQIAALRIMRNMNVSEERLLDHIISMWSTVHGLTSIATMENVTYAYNWKDKIEDILRNEI